MPTDGRRFVLHALALLAILGVVLSTAWVVFWASFTLDSAGPSPTMVRQEALAAAIGCALLLATVVPLRAGRIAVAPRGGRRSRRSARPSRVVQFDTHAHGHDVDDGNPWIWVVWMFLVTPTTWPVLALLLATPFLRGRSRRAPRSPRAR